MPTKERQDNGFPHQTHIHGFFDDDAISVYHTCGSPRMHERITYDNAKLAVYYTSCTHVRDDRMRPSYPLTSQKGESAEWTTDRALEHIRYSLYRHGSFAYDYAYNIAVEALNDSDLSTKAFWAMCPRIPKSISILNFLFELKEFFKMFKFWSLRISTLRNISNLELNAQYGWRPFLSDIVTILETLQRLRQGLKKLSAEAHKVQVRHFRRVIAKDKTPLGFQWGDPLTESWTRGTFVFSDGYVPNVSLPSIRYAGQVICSQMTSPAVYHATMKYTYFVPELKDHIDNLKAFLDAFGVNWDPQTIWDAIPFSFVVDWFLSVGDYLSRRFASPNLNVQLRVIDYCSTVKIKARANGIFVIPRDTDNLSLGFQEFPVDDVLRLFIRVPGPPDRRALLKNKNPLIDLEKVLIALALGHNCSKPHKRHPPRVGRRRSPDWIERLQNLGIDVPNPGALGHSGMSDSAYATNQRRASLTTALINQQLGTNLSSSWSRPGRAAQFDHSLRSQPQIIFVYD